MRKLLVKKISLHRPAGRPLCKKAASKPRSFYFMSGGGDSPKPRGGGSARGKALPGAVLIVEDDEAHAYMLERALSSFHVANPVRIVGSGTAMANYLQGLDPCTDRGRFPWPVVILLDLGLPGMDGFETLRWLHNDPAGRAVPVVVITGIDDWRQLDKAFGLGAITYLTKPVNPVDLEHVLKTLNVPLQFEQRAPLL